MSPEQQRIAIAEACGWLVTDDGSNNYKIMGSRHGWKQGFKPESIPDYLNDLNAMTDALTTMTEDQWAHYVKILSGETREESLLPTHYWQLDGVIDILKATAAQRAEAFLRTIAAWKEAWK